jgi:outer membrane autotransporter protein
MKVGRSDSGTLTGYDINSQSTYALYDKKMNNRYRLGLGMSFTHTDTDYNDDSRRKNFNVQAYVPLTYKLGNHLTAVSMAELGYSDGDYTRKSLNQSFKADTSAITYGLLNEIRYKSNLGPVNVTPFVGLNALGWYQDSINEGHDAQALHISATNVFSLESALGIYVDKDIEFNEDNRLNIALGAGYYHEFADPYRGFDTHHSNSIGKYRLKNKIHSDDRGLISAKLKYDYKAFSIYAELLQYLEEEHPTEFDGGLQYRF